MKLSTEHEFPVNVWINDQKRSLDGAISIDQLLHQLKFANPAVAVEVNRELVPRADFATTILKEDDRVEIVSLSGGG